MSLPLSYKVYNDEEIDAMMLFAFIIESFVKKTKRLKLVEVVFLLKEITNLEMDLRFEAAAANEYAEKRGKAYPNLKEQFDLLWHAIDADTLDKTSDFYTTLKAVKDAHPKG